MRLTPLGGAVPHQMTTCWRLSSDCQALRAAHSQVHARLVIPGMPVVARCRLSASHHALQRLRCPPVEERNLYSVAYKNLVGALRTSWRAVSSICEKEAKASAEDWQLEETRRFREKVEAELHDLCSELLDQVKTMVDGSTTGAPPTEVSTHSSAHNRRRGDARAAARAHPTCPESRGMSRRARKGACSSGKWPGTTIGTWLRCRRATTGRSLCVAVASSGVLCVPTVVACSALTSSVRRVSHVLRAAGCPSPGAVRNCPEGALPSICRRCRGVHAQLCSANGTPVWLRSDARLH